MKIGKIQLHLRARSHARLNHVSALPLSAIIPLTPNRALADCCPKWTSSGWTCCMLRMVCFCSVVIVTLATGQTAWAQQGSEENTRPLPPPPPSAAPFVESAPFVAFKRIEDQNGSVRIVFKGIGPGGAKIELRDVIVAPDASVRFEPIKGQVVIDTRSGEGLAKTGDLSTKLDTAKVASIAVNGKIEVQNQGDVPLVMMIYVVEGR
jgi:hypothetical protein